MTHCAREEMFLAPQLLRSRARKSVAPCAHRLTAAATEREKQERNLLTVFLNL
jgi:hypothetical protein